MRPPADHPRRALLVLGGDPPSTALIRQWHRWADFSVAADGGVEAFLRGKCIPDVATGDFDSYHGDLSALGCRVQVKKHQDATDFEKALEELSPDFPWSHIVVLGATGGRLDHSLTNLLIAGQAYPEAVFEIIDAFQRVIRVTPGVPLVAFPVGRGQVVSLVPFTEARGVVTEGLRWGLDGGTLALGGQLGQSNVAECEELSVRIESGLLFVLINRMD